MKKARIGSALGVVGIAVACSGGDFDPEPEELAPGNGIELTMQAATTCPSVTATLDEHVIHGRATKKTTTLFIWTFTGYYATRSPNAVASTEYLGVDGSQQVTLYVASTTQRDWSADANQCIDSAICGDGVRNVTTAGNEPCEGTDLGGETCVSRGFSGGGTLACTPDCGFDTSDCEGTCGNGIVERGEDCDGGIAGDPSCENYVSWRYIGGTLACGSDCRLDTSGCVEPVCGNGVIEQGEDCDGTTFSEVDTCAEYNVGWESGTLGCDDRCRFDLSACVSKCGNGVIDSYQGAYEECDGDRFGPQFEGKSCSDLPFPHRLFPFDVVLNYASGELRCEGCAIKTDQCQPYPGCYVISGKLPSIRCF